MKPRNSAWLDVVTPELSQPLLIRVRGRSMAPTLRPGDEVLIEPVSADVLSTGDWIVVRGVEGGFIHRYLGMRDGLVLTKGDGHFGFDPLWMPESVVGRVIEARRAGRHFYRRAMGQVRRERLFSMGHRIVGEFWELGRRLKALLLALLALLLGVSLVIAAVTLVDFYAEVEDDQVTLYWETASETNNLGFYLWRSITETEGYVNISEFVASKDQGAGAFYEFGDVKATPGVLYYYRLQDVPDDGKTGAFTDPITASLPLLADTPTATATVTPTPTPTPASQPSNTNVRFWAEETELEAGDCTTVRWQTDNVKAVFLDGIGVEGDGAKTYCPCETQSHFLSVTYQDDTIGDFVVELTVTGECVGVTRTATPTSTPVPTSTPENESSASPTPTSQPDRAVPTATPVPMEAPEASPSPSATPESKRITPTLTPTISSEVTVTRGVVEGDTQDVEVEKALSIWLLVVGGIVGLGFVGAGILMWKRRQ